MSEEQKFCTLWNQYRRPKITTAEPSQELVIDQHWIRLLKTRKLYTDMRPVWRALWTLVTTTVVGYKQQLACFLAARAKIRVLGKGSLTSSIQQQAWCWYHCTTPMYPKEHTELGIITNSECRAPSRFIPRINVLAELLTVIDPQDISAGLSLYSEEALLIDQESSEIEWRKGLAYGRQ